VNMIAYRRRLPVAPARGVTLVELMVSLVIGLLVTGAALTLFVTNRQTYVAAENLGRVQEHARSAFELMARDLREAAGNACGNDVTQVNVVNDDGSAWYVNWNAGLHGYDGATVTPGLAFGTSAGSRVAGTDAIDTRAFVDDGVQIVDHVAASAQFKLSTVNHDLNDGDIAMACDPAHAAIFQVTTAQPGINDTVVHNKGTGTPGNCSKGLGGVDPADCSTNGIAYTFGCLNGDKDTCADDPDPKKSQRWPAFVAKLQAARWFIGNDPSGGHSLYRGTVHNKAGTLEVVNSPITQGVDDMTLEYLVDKGDGYAAASATTDWRNITAIRITLLLSGQDRIGTDGQVLQRTLEHVVSLRNREP